MIGKKQPIKLNIVIENMLKTYGYDDILIKKLIENQWSDIAGEKISEISEIDDYIKGTLYIKVESSSWRNELQFHKNELLGKIKKNKKLREIRTIIFR